MAGETLDFKVTVDANQATSEVSRFGGKLSELEVVAKKSGLNVGSIGEAMKSMQGKLAPVAAAVSGVANALGQTNGEAGKVVAAAGQVAAAFAAGGPFGAALAAGTYAVDALSQAWERELKAQDAALKAQYASLDTAVTRLEKAKGQLDAIVASSMPREWQISAEEKKKLADVDRVIAENQASLAKIVDKVKTDARRAEIAGLELAIKKNEQERQAVIDTANAQRKAIRDVESDRKSAEFLANMRAEAERKRQAAKAGAEKRSAARQQLSADRFQIYSADLEDEERQLREAKKASDKRIEEQRKADAVALAESFKYYDEQFQEAERAEEKRTEVAAREAEKRMAIAEAERKAQIDSLTSFATGAAAAAGRFAAEAAMGQEEAFANLLNAAAQAAGGQIVLEGGKVLSTGIAGALVGNPAAAGQIAGGLGLVAAGTAVQVGGPAAVQSLLGMAGGGAGASASSASRDRGASPRSSRGGDGGGPLVINVSYGVGGPLPEDTAREISRVMRTGDRRRGAA